MHRGLRLAEGHVHGSHSIVGPICFADDADYARASNLVSQRGISSEEFDRVNGDRAEAVGSLKVAKAQREMAAVNLDYTKVRAPITGHSSSVSHDAHATGVRAEAGV